MRVGTDIVNIPEFERRLAKSRGKFKRDVFFDEEWEDGRTEHLAGVFAAKEAAMKALDFAPGSWKSVEIKKMDSGKPRLVFYDSKLKEINCDVSISHARDYALAVVVCGS